MREICHGIAAAHGATCGAIHPRFVPTINWPQCTPVAIRAAQAVVGHSNVDANVAPMMISEDSAALTAAGPFVFIGNGATGATGGVPLHNAQYDFNDAVLPIGARYLQKSKRQRLAV